MIDAAPAVKAAIPLQTGVSPDDARLAIMNIMEDFYAEKLRSEDAQRAMLNILADLDFERREALRSAEELEASRRQVAVTEKLSALGTLVSGVGHEVRTPLTYIRNNLAIIQKWIRNAVGDNPEIAALSEALEKHIARANEGVERIDLIVQQLRTFARPEIMAESAGIHDLVGAAVDLFNSTRKGELTVETDLGATPPIDVDKGQIQQVIINLLNNAAEASAAGSVLNVRTMMRGDGVAIEVEDHGSGIPENVQERLFDPFFTTKTEGTGLGLAICRRIIEAHQGTLDFKTKPGQGTTFIIHLPLGASSAKEVDA